MPENDKEPLLPPQSFSTASQDTMGYHAITFDALL